MISNATTQQMPQLNNFVCDLLSGSTPISGLTIFNQTNAPVLVFVGTQSPNLQPNFIVPANAFMALPINASNYVLLTCAGTFGSYYAKWQDETVAAGSSGIPTAPVNTQPFVVTTNTNNIAGTTTYTDAEWGPVASFLLSTLTPLVSTINLPKVYIQKMIVTGLPPYVTAGLNAFFIAGPGNGWFPLFTLDEGGTLDLGATGFLLDQLGASIGTTIKIFASFANYDTIEQIKAKSVLVWLEGYFSQ